MALFTVVTKRPPVNVIAAMTTAAVHGQGDDRRRGLAMASQTVEIGVGAIQHEIRLASVVEDPQEPVVRVVT